MPIFGNKITALKDNSIVNLSNIESQVWFKKSYDYGLILVSAASSDGFIFNTNLGMGKFISEGSGKYWKESMSNPSKYSRWIIINDNANGKDSLLNQLNIASLNKNFELLENNNGYRIFKIKGN